MARMNGKDRGLFELPKDSGIWWICYFDQKGKRHRERIGTKAAAQKQYLRRKAEIAEDRLKPPSHRRRADQTLADAIKKYLETTGQGKRSWRDDRNFGRLWTEALGDLALDQIGAQEVENWKVEWGKQLAPGTVNRRLSFLRRVFNIAIRNGLEVKNPVSQVGLFRENNSRERFLSPDELIRLQSAIPDEWWHVVEFAYLTGLRQAEQFCLRWEYVNLEVGSLTIPRSKSGKARHVPLNSRALVILKDLQVNNTLGSPWVFLGQRSRHGQNHLSANWFYRRIFTPALILAGIDNLCWHDLRHHYASILAMAGVDMRTVQELLGQHSLQMAQRYSHLSPGHQRAAVEKLVPPTVPPSGEPS